MISLLLSPVLVNVVVNLSSTMGANDCCILEIVLNFSLS